VGGNKRDATGNKEVGRGGGTAAIGKAIPGVANRTVDINEEFRGEDVKESSKGSTGALSKGANIALNTVGVLSWWGDLETDGKDEG
jgi:hypothetical protein